MIGIYKITNIINGKCYIGQSVNIQKRFNAHKSVAFNPNSKCYNYLLYRAIRKYGLNNFLFEILEECSEDKLDEKEILYIAKYNAHGEKGYNLDDGGSQAKHYNKLSDDLVSEIIDRLKTSFDNSEVIGEEFGVSGRIVRGINSGEYCFKITETYPIRQSLCTINSLPRCYCKNCRKEISKGATLCIECLYTTQMYVVERPDPLKLAQLIKENGFAQTGKMFGVSATAIKKWCKSYNIPYLKNDLIQWYDDQLGIEDLSDKQNVKKDCKKRVNQIDINTNSIIATFESSMDAARALGKKKGSHINEVCNGKLKQAYGFLWEYA